MALIPPLCQILRKFGAADQLPPLIQSDNKCTIRNGLFQQGGLSKLTSALPVLNFNDFKRAERQRPTGSIKPRPVVFD